MSNFVYAIPAMGILGILVLIAKSAWVSKQDAGDKKHAGVGRLHSQWCYGFS